MRIALTRRLATVCTLAGTVIASSTLTPSAPPRDAAAELVSVLTSAAPHLLDDALDTTQSAHTIATRSLVDTADASGDSRVELPAEATHAVPVGSARVGLAPKQPGALGEATQLRRNAVAFVGDHLTHVAVDRGDEYTLATVIKAPEAGESFPYAIRGPRQVRVELAESGGAFFIVNDVIVGGVLAPWAVDANGVDVPTRYITEDGLLVQIVDHLGGGYAYPIVADPTYYGESLIDRVVTRKSAKGRELSVYTTSWWRVAATAGGITQQVRWQITDEFARRVPSPWDTTGARQQVSCHAWWAQLKYPWNIELWRPTVGETATAAALCNPTK